MKLFRLKYKGLSASPKGEDREKISDFFINSLIDYLRDEKLDVPTYLIAGQLPEFAYGEHGKPYFKTDELSEIYFSLSHTKDFAGIAFAKSEIGFDCENVSSRNYSMERLKKIANRVFTAKEKDYCFDISTHADSNEVEKRFFEVWVAKEAYSKYTGTGFSAGFKNICTIDIVGENIICRATEEHKGDIISYAICSDKSERINNA